MGKVNALLQDAQEAREEAQWLENDWFTSGETSWEEYYHEEKLSR